MLQLLEMDAKYHYNIKQNYSIGLWHKPTDKLVLDHAVGQIFSLQKKEKKTHAIFTIYIHKTIDWTIDLSK